MIENNVDVGTEFYKQNGIEVSTISDANNNEHYFILKFPNGERLVYDIELEHYKLNVYWNFRKNILENAKLKLRKIKLESIKKKLKS
jgi:hypothetical protein